MAQSKKAARVGKVEKPQPIKFDLEEWCAISEFLFGPAYGGWTVHMSAKASEFVSWMERYTVTKRRGRK